MSDLDLIVARLHSLVLDSPGGRLPKSKANGPARQAIADLITYARVVTPPPAPPAPAPPVQPSWPRPPDLTRAVLINGAAQVKPRSIGIAYFPPLDDALVDGADISNFSEFGVLMDEWADGAPHVNAKLWEVRNVRARNIGSGRTSNGRAEAGIHAGGNGWVHHCDVEGDWEAVWTGWGRTLIEHVTARSGHVGVYHEHGSSGEVRYSRVTGGDAPAVNVEWWYGGNGSSDLHYHDCTLERTTPGPVVVLDAGTYACRFERLTIVGTEGFSLPKYLVDPTRPNVVDEASIVWDARIPLDKRVTYHDRPIGASDG